MWQVLENLNDDDNETNTSFVQYERERLSPCKITLVILGTFCILIGIINMVIFYVLPSQEINQNKRKYVNYEFSQPDKLMISIHFLEHIFLILTGVMMILGIIPELPGRLIYILPTIFISLLLITFYVLQVVFTIFHLRIV